MNDGEEMRAEGWRRRSPSDLLLRRLGLRQEEGRGGLRSALVLAGIVWLPFALIEAVAFLVSGQVDPIFRAPATHTRMLVAIPLYLMSDWLFHARTEICIHLIQDGRLFPAEESARVDALVRRAASRRDSRLAEGILLFAALGMGQAGVWSGAAGLFGGIRSDSSAAFFWYGFVAQPIFMFLLLRWLWRWATWSTLLWRLSHLPMRLAPMHPDKAGGLGFLNGPTIGTGLFLLASSAVIAATFAERMLQGGASLQSFGPEALILLMGAELFALAPLLVFSAKLARTRWTGLAQYGALGLDYVHLFHQKWWVGGDTRGLLGTSDIQSLADIQNAFHCLTETRLAPFGKWELVFVALVVLLPMLSLLLIQFPITEILARLVSALA